jgi:uncharacterized protein YegL
MTKENYTLIGVVIDRSGSMGGLVHDTIGGFNSLLKEHKAVEGMASLSLCTFSVGHTLTHYDDINHVEELTTTTYRTGGGTALLDALGDTINEIGSRLAAKNEEDRPSKVVIMVITDGQENASSRFTKNQIKEMISHQEQVYNWSFAFVGANMDAVGEGTAIGVSKGNSLNYSASAGGTHRVYGAMSNSLRRARVAGASMKASAPLFTPEEAASIMDSSAPVTVDPATPSDSSIPDPVK